MLKIKNGMSTVAKLFVVNKLKSSHLLVAVELENEVWRMTQKTLDEVEFTLFNGDRKVVSKRKHKWSDLAS